MGKAKDFPAVFRGLRKILAMHSRHLVVVKDEDGDDTGEIEDVQAHIDETDDGEPPF